MNYIHIKWGIYLTRGRRNIDVQKRIIDALKDGPLTWSELHQKTDVSKGALSAHLKILIKLKCVVTRTKKGRPPTTIYYLQKRELLDIFYYTTRNFPEGLAESFVNDIVKPNMEKVLSGSRVKLFHIYYTELSSFLDQNINVDAIFNSKNHKKMLNEEIDLSSILLDADFIPDTTQWNDLQHQEFINKESSDISIQLLLFIYELEKNILNNLASTKEFQEELRKRGNLDGFIVMPFVQKYNAWKDFDNFAKWWNENITPTVSNISFLRYLAIDIVQKSKIWKTPKT